jgi:DnaK suppressor protein
MPVTTTARHPHQICQNILEERYRLFTLRLAELTAAAGLPDDGGYDPATLQALLRWARQGVADAALALQRMSAGTYGVCDGCGHDIPAGHLRAQPEALYCVPCEQRRPMPAPMREAPTTMRIDPGAGHRTTEREPGSRLTQVA